MQSDFQLHDSFTFWVTRLSHVLQDSFNRELEVLDITWPQWMLVNLVAHGKAQTPGQIARLVGVDRSAVTRLVDRLVKKGMVERQLSDNDRRSVVIALTEGGARLVEHLDEVAMAHEQRVLSQLPDGDLDTVRKLLHSLLESGALRPPKKICAS